MKDAQELCGKRRHASARNPEKSPTAATKSGNCARVV
jgi:hypothetical protein